MKTTKKYELTHKGESFDTMQPPFLYTKFYLTETDGHFLAYYDKEIVAMSADKKTALNEACDRICEINIRHFQQSNIYLGDIHWCEA